MPSKSKGEETRSRVLNTAMAIFNAQGYNSTSITDIIKATGVKKGNLYFHFPSKEDLAASLVQEAEKEYLNFLTQNIKGASPIERLDSILMAVYEFHKKKNFIGGCLFGNMALEMADTNPEFTKLIHNVFNNWIRMLVKHITEAQKSGALNKKIQPQKLAKQIVAALEGGVMLTRMSKNGNDLLDCIDSIRFLIGVKK